MKPQNRSLQRSILAVLLCAMAPGALHADIVQSEPQRLLTISTTVSSPGTGGIPGPLYQPGEEHVTSTDEGDFNHTLTQEAAFTFAQGNSSVSQLSSVTNSAVDLLISGDLRLTTSLSSEFDPDPNATSSWGGAGADLRTTFIVTFSTSEPLGYLLKATTAHGPRVTVRNTAYLLLRGGAGIGDLLFGKQSTLPLPDGPDSGTNSGILPAGQYALTAELTDAAVSNVSLTNYANANSVVFSMAVKPLTHLPDFGPFTYSTATPARSSNPWTFSAQFPSTAEGLQLQVQSTLTTNDPSSWAPLPGNSFMTGPSPNWTLNPQTVPTGDRYFRVVASAPFTYSNVVSTTTGPISVLQGFEPFGDLFVFPWAALVADGVNAFGTWDFKVQVPPENLGVDGVRVHFQWSATSDAPPSGWSDFGSTVFDADTARVDTTNPPLGTVFFRAVASAPTYVDFYSVVRGPYTIEPPQPIMTDTFASSTTALLSSVPGVQSPSNVLLQATNCSSATFSVPPNTSVVLAASITAFAADNCSTVAVNVPLGATATIPGLTAGNGTTVAAAGTIKGAVSIVGHDGGSIVAQGGGNIVAQGGGNLVSHDGGSIVGHDGGSIVAQGGGNIVAQGGGNLVNVNGSNLVGPSGGTFRTTVRDDLRPIGRVSRMSLPPAQPAFTGLMRIEGDYSQFAGSLTIGIAGTNTTTQGAQQYDQLLVTGQANLLGGRIAFGLFNPDNQTNTVGLFQPPDGATFDVVVASNIVVTSNIRVIGPIWGDGQFFTGSVVTRPDGLQAVRLVATHVPPRLYLQNAGSTFQLLYPTNYSGYTIQSAPALSSTNWTTLATNTNPFVLSLTNTSGFFRLSKP